MNSFRLLVFLLLPVLGCSTGDADVEVIPVLEWEGQALSLNQDALRNGQSLRFTEISFYLSDAHVLQGNSKSNPQGIDLFKNGLGSFWVAVPQAINPDTFYFSLGVPGSLNDSTGSLAIPAWQYGDEHPLSAAQNMYWSWKPGYVFMKLEGRIDLDGDGQYVSAGETFSIHTGLNSLLRTLSLANPSSQLAPKYALKIDLARLFDGYDLQGAGLNVHAMNAQDADFARAEYISNRLPYAFYALEPLP
jgi:hypothetical protein